MPHGHIGDIPAPDLIGSVDDHTSDEVRGDFVLCTRRAALRSRIYGHKAHASHEALNSFTIDFEAQSPQQEHRPSEGSIEFSEDALLDTSSPLSSAASIADVSRQG